MKKTKTKTQLMKLADKKFSEYWRNEIGKCECCGKKEGLQLAHIISRNCRKLRYLRDNTLVLCWHCHWMFHSKPLEFTAFVEKVKGKGSGRKLIKESNDLKPLSNSFYEDILNTLITK